MHEEGEPTQETAVPFAKAYGVDNVHAQRALRTAAVVLLDLAMSEDLAARFEAARVLRTDPVEHGRIEDGGGFVAEASMFSLPQRFADRYQEISFIKDWVVTLAIVGWKLAQPERHMLSNVAEELAMFALIQEARANLELWEVDDAGAVEALNDLMDVGGPYEDTDFLALYESRLMPPEAVQQVMGFTPLAFGDWFTGFADPEARGVVHPYLRDGKGPDGA